MKKIVLLWLLTAMTFRGNAQTDTVKVSGNNEVKTSVQGNGTVLKSTAKGKKNKKNQSAGMCHIDSCFQNCGGTSFDTICPERKECCITGHCRLNGTHILQKNFADIQPFAYDYFRLNGRKENLCIRICNINRIAYDINANGQIVKATLPDTSIFDELAKVYQNPPVASKETSEPNNKTVPVGFVRAEEKKTQFEKLQQSADSIKNLIKPIARDLYKQLNNLEHYVLFAADVPVIIGSECCSQQLIKDKIGSHPDIKAYRSDITFENVLRIVKTAMPPLFDSTKENEKKIRQLVGELVQLISNYEKNFCETSKDSTHHCMQLPSIQKLPDQESVDKGLAIAARSDKAKLLKSLRVLEDLLARVNNNTNFFYTKCFDKEEAEFIKIYFKATPKEGFASKLDSQVYYYTVPVNGRFKWAIGPSLNFHFGGTLINQSYSIDSARNNAGNIMTDTFSIAKNSQRSRVIPHVGVMAHFYWQRHWSVTPGITIGISTSPTQFSDLRAYLGASGIIGGPIKGKLILNAGLAGAAVDRLKPNLVEGPNAKNRILFNGNNLPSADQLVDKVFRIGFFVGMTYNLRD